MSPFVSPLSAIARAHDPTVIGSVAPWKGPRRFCPNRSDRCRALMLTCRNSPLWQCCERCNNVLSLCWLARSIQQHGHHVTCALIGMNHKLATSVPRFREISLDLGYLMVIYGSGKDFWKMAISRDCMEGFRDKRAISREISCIHNHASIGKFNCKN